MSLNTSATPTVSEALETRITVRDFLDTPVPNDVLRAILEKAMRSPSGGNLQPWKLHVMTGETLAAFKKTAAERTLSGKLEEPTYRAYPSPLWEPQKMGRLVWLAQNAKFFEAPVGIIITVHKNLEMPQYMDVGILLQSIMLLARENGLHTAPQGWWRKCGPRKPR